MYSIKNELENNVIYKEKLFCRGFYFTNTEVFLDKYPFYGLWDSVRVKNYILIVHPKQHYYISNSSKAILLMIGHAYDPFDKLSKEQEIIDRLNYLLEVNSELFWDKFNNLTGLFTLICIKDGFVYLVGDPSGMQATFYSMKDDKIFISSHTNLIGDLLNLKWDSYVKQLSCYKFFPLLGNSLPGDITPFKRVKRLVPNHYLRFGEYRNICIKRFYTPFKLQKSEDELVTEAAMIMHSNMQLIAEKWSKPAVSLTGGCDSRTTLACTQGLYNLFSYFSYISSESEKVDAEAAKQICEKLGLPHNTYEIPDCNDKLDDLEIVSDILFWNTGGIIRSKDNDIRKRIYFSDIEDFDVEVKSWASEIGRAYYSKRFHKRKDFGEMPSPRKCTTLYKFFLHDRKLVSQTDEIFADYLKKYFSQDVENPVSWQEQFFWEFRVPSWNGIVITGEHQYSYDITIPYNNRKLLNLLLSENLEDRIEDVLYEKIRAYMNPEIDRCGISVTNLLHTENREIAENVYYKLHTTIPF